MRAIGPASPGAPVAEPTADAADGPADGDGPDWPDDAVEAAMIVEQRELEEGADVTPRAASARPAEPIKDQPAEPLPNLDTLVQAIPEEIRETLDELFRARFTSVQRVPKTALKS